MRLNRHNSRQRQSGAADWLRYMLVVLIAVLALDLTRRFVKVYQRGQGKPALVTAQPAQSEPTNEITFLPPAKAEPLPMVRMTPAPLPANDNPDAPEPDMTPTAKVAATTNLPPRSGRTMTKGVASGRVQADYVLPRGKGLPITVFKPGAITLIAVPGDDGGDAGSP